MAHVADHTADALRTVLEGIHRVVKRRNYIFSDDSEGCHYQKNTGNQSGYADDQCGYVDKGQMIPCGLCPAADGSIEGGNILIRRFTPAGNVSVGCRVGLLGLAVGAGTHQINQGMLKRVIILNKGLIKSRIFLRNRTLITGQHSVQRNLFFLNLLDKPNHGSVVCGHDMGQGQQMDVHHRAPDLLQLPFADHILIYNGLCI